MAGLTLWLLRHAKTVADPPPGGSDFDRPLAPRGRRDARALAELMGRDGLGLGLPEVELPQMALVSPAARTAATAELALSLLAMPPARYLVPDFYGADPEEVLDHLRTLPEEVTSVMVIGHNPTIQDLSRGLIAAQDTEGRTQAKRRGFPTCALGIYRFEFNQWADLEAKSATLAGLFVPPFA